MSTNEQGIDQWKQKYYDQLDQLEQKEKDWELLENTLKRTIGRLSLAAEGQHATLDRHINDLRKSIKNTINRQRLESIVDDISSILTKLEEKQTGSQRNSVQTLEKLMSEIHLPESLHKSRDKLVKQLHKSDDDNSAVLITKTVELLSSAFTLLQKNTDQKQPSAELDVLAQKPEKGKAGFLDRLFHSGQGDDKISTDSDKVQTFSADLSLISAILQHILTAIPWPQSIKKDADECILLIQHSLTETDLHINLKKLEQIIQQWPETETRSHLPDSSTLGTDQISTYKTCLLELFDNIDNKDSPNGKIAALKLSAQSANNKSELNALSVQLSSLFKDKFASSVSTGLDDQNIQRTANVHGTLQQSISDPSLQPSIQELLIRLLEQLIVPSELQDQADKMKHRLEQDTDPANWKLLLKDVASLINSIRSYMQKEKLEFEHFLQQVTDRLKTMDQFLQTETKNLQTAEAEGKDFDNNIKLNVNEIRHDMNQATELAELKQSVSTKLDTISSNIQLYRESENTRILQSQQQVEDMHTRMHELEKESETLKKVVIEKNKQAMFDTLTGIPNRLSYDKKIEEEVSRWKRFDNPLSLAIWDIDFFKKVNDTYGHKAGDKVLRTVAQLLHKRIRATDFLARYGGEEFVMLLPGTKQEETLRLVNQLREQVEHCGFHNHGESVTITVSCGISSFSEGDSVAQVFERADKALYKAKKNGRNQCVAASCLS